jgi:predicted unusual protein kinase regulating ubiquinone biosynthesis (AarF/ABC1/UbiB family)
MDLFTAVVFNRGREVGSLMIDRSRGDRRHKISIKDRENFECEMANLLDGVHREGLSLGRIGISAVLQQVLHLCYHHQVKYRYNTCMTD